MRINTFVPFLALFLLIGLVSTRNALSQNKNLTVPEWMVVDHGKKMVTMNIEVGKTKALNNWNFNGYAKGEATIVVPEGYNVVLNFKNGDPNMVHSIGVGEKPDAFPPTYMNPKPVFEGAMSSNPTDLARGTKPNQVEKLSFTADKAGEYALICYMPAHAFTGMWIGFDVSSSGKAGVQTQMP